MRAIRVCYLQMLEYMRRDRMLFAACVAPVFAGFLFRFAIPPLETALTGWLESPAILSPYYALIDIFFAMLSPAMFCFVSAMVSLEEADEGITDYLFVTPLGRNGYLTARLCIPAAAAFLVTAVLLPVFQLTPRPAMDMLLLAAGGALQGVIISLLILTFSTNKLEGMAVTKLSSLTIFGAAVPFFVRNSVQYILSPLPSFWIGKAVLESKSFYLLPAFILSALWICFLIKRQKTL